MASLQNRIIGVLQLKAATFEEIEGDNAATSQAAMVVLAAALSGGLASLSRYFSPTALIVGLLLSLVAWAISSFIVLMVGTKLMPGKNTQADIGQLLRVMGFAQAPGLFGIIAIIPFLGILISLALWVWSLAAMVVAVKQALDYDDTVKAIIVCVIALVIQIVISGLVALFGIGAAVAGGALAS